MHFQLSTFLGSGLTPGGVGDKQNVTHRRKDTHAALYIKMRVRMKRVLSFNLESGACIVLC